MNILISDSILDDYFSIHYDLGHAPTLNSAFSLNQNKKAHFANQLFLYDKIIFSTQDFGIVPILIKWMGIKAFEDAVEQSAFKFLRRNNMIGYYLNGLELVKMERGEIKDWQWWQDALFTEDAGSALDNQLKNECPFIRTNERDKLINNILTNTKPMKLDNDIFKKNIASETYNDIIHDNSLKAFIFKESKEPVQLDRLPEIDNKTVRFFQYEIKDRIGLIINIAEVNLILQMGLQNEEADLLIPEGAQKILGNKLSRANIHLESSFSKLLELKDIPDIGVKIKSGDWTLSDIWKNRETKNARAFRKWLREADPQNSDELIKKYIASIDTSSGNLPTRILRFLIPTGIGLVNTPAGIAASCADSFFINKLIKGYSPSFFLNQLNKLPNKT